MGTTKTKKEWSINLRHDQTLADGPQVQSPHVRIYAPQWVQTGLDLIKEKLKGFKDIEFSIPTGQLDHIKPDLDIIGLHRIILNEAGGKFRLPYEYSQFYFPDCVHEEVIKAGRDLVRNCIMAGLDETTAYGGFGLPGPPVEQRVPVVILNTIGLQFTRENSNTGRICLGYHGMVTELIKQNVLTQEKLKSKPKVLEGQFDAILYQAIIAKDVELILFVANDTFVWHGKGIHLKILRLGLGAFAGNLLPKTDPIFLTSVINGLEQYFNRNDQGNNIKLIEFPFSQATAEETKRLESFSGITGVKFTFTKNDVLLTTDPDLMLVVTNCGDNHVVLGNEMNYGSVDGMIGENIKSRGSIFNPNLNKMISYKFVDV